MRLWRALVCLFVIAFPARAETVHVAVAANFTAPARVLADLFTQQSGHRVILSFGSSGQLYAQITQAAPYDVFLSADAQRPAKLLQEGHAVPGTQMTYAIGKLALWSRDQRADAGEAALRSPFTKLAIANPAAAPYGGAALDVLQRLGLMAQLQPRLVQGTSIAQTFQFVETGNAELGFIALSQIDGGNRGGRWIVPQSLYEPLLQDGVVTKQGERNHAARDFMSFLTTPAARDVMTRFGYEVQP